MRHGVPRGRLAQLVEHLVYTERVGGSSPSAPTIPVSIRVNAAPRAGFCSGSRRLTLALGQVKVSEVKLTAGLIEKAVLCSSGACHRVLPTSQRVGELAAFSENKAPNVEPNLPLITRKPLELFVAEQQVLLRC
jgi:hypothetical protein